jgi:hypothetical protein
MKLNKLSLAVAAACSTLAAPSMAITSTNISNPTTSIFVSGATAMDVGLLTAVVKFCTAGTLHRYSVSNNAVFFCNAPGFSTGQLAVHKYSVGGSGNGVGPVNNNGTFGNPAFNNTTLPFLNLANINGTNCPETVSGTFGATTKTLAGITYRDVACVSAGATQPQASFVGISDVEPTFFAGGAANAGNLKVESLSTVIFGVPVTRNVYEALQSAQSKTVGSVAEADMPSITTAQATSMYTVPGLDWGTLLGITIPGGGDQTIFVARRVDSSGTQKTFEGVIARTVNGEAATGAKSCQVNVDVFVPYNPATDVALNNAATQCNGSKTTVAGSGSGDVTACLATHLAGNRGAVGVLTTEIATSTVNTASGNFFFLKINDKAPTDTNVQSGAYTWYSDSSLNTPLSNPTGTSATVVADNTAFLTKLKANFAVTPVVHGFGNAGLMTLDQVTGTPGGNPWSRVVGGVLNNCQQARGVY